MHIGRLIKEVVEECDAPFRLDSETTALGAVLCQLGAYVTLRGEASIVHGQGNVAKADEMHRRCQEMLNELQNRRK